MRKLPNKLVGKGPNDGKNNCVGSSNHHLGAAGRQAKKNAGRQQKEEQSAKKKHIDVHHGVAWRGGGVL